MKPTKPAPPKLAVERGVTFKAADGTFPLAMWWTKPTDIPYRPNIGECVVTVEIREVTK